MSGKFNLVILDADVVIYLHEINLWKAICSNYSIIISKTVADECQFYFDPNNNGIRVDIEINKYINDGLITVLDEELNIQKFTEMHTKLQQMNAPEIDPGETEMLYLKFASILGDAIICAADNGAIKCAVFLELGRDCISLEELLDNCGTKRSLRKQFSKNWLDKLREEAEVIKVMNTQT